MKKKAFLFLCGLAISMLIVNAQKAYESSARFDDKMSGPCVSIQVKLTMSDAQKVMNFLLKNEGLKGGRSSKQKIAYEKPVAFPALSPSYINLFVSFEETGYNEPATVNVFVRKGPHRALETSSTDPNLIVNVKNFLEQKYTHAVHLYEVTMLIEAKQKEIERTKKELDNLQKQINNRRKDIENYEKYIESTKVNIENAKVEIQNAINSIENHKQLLVKQEEELTQILKDEIL